MLKPEPLPGIPEQIARIAQASFPKGNTIMRLRDEFGSLYTDEGFAQLFPSLGKPAIPPWRLALITVIQFMENLTDRQAADAVRARIDWKYALGLQLTNPGFHYSVLSEFRTRLIIGGAEHLLLDRMLEHFRARGLVKARGKRRTDSTHVLASIRVMNRAEQVGETLRAALNELAKVAPEWLKGIAEPAWYERYAHRVEEYRLPKSKAGRKEYLHAVGTDGFTLLDAIERDQPDLAKPSSVEILQEVWDRHYQRTGKGRRRISSRS